MTASDELAIRQAIAKWHSATASGDVESVLGLMADDVVFLVAGKPPMKGKDAFEKGLRTVLSTHSIQGNAHVE